MKTFLILSAYCLAIAYGQIAVQPPINQNIPVNPPIGIDVPQQSIPVSPPIWHLPQNTHPTVEILININGVPTPYNQQNLISITINDPNHPDFIPIVPNDEEPIIGGMDFLPEYQPIIGGMDFLPEYQPIHGGLDFIDNIQPIHGGIGIIEGYGIEKIHGGLGFIPNEELRVEDDNESEFTPY